MSSLREKIRDQKYTNGFITTDFPKVYHLGKKALKSPNTSTVIYDGKPNSREWALIPGTNCKIRSIVQE